MIDSCLEVLSPGLYRCRNTGLVFRTGAKTVHCCSANRATLPPPVRLPEVGMRNARPMAEELPAELLAQCVGCKHRLSDGRCRMFLAGCDARHRRAAALRFGCRYRKLASSIPHGVLLAYPQDKFVTTTELTHDTAELSKHIDWQRIEAIIGVARSGLIPASILAAFTHKPLLAISPMARKLMAFGSGHRLGDEGQSFRRVLVVDDSVASGQSLHEVLTAIHATLPNATVQTAAIYAAPEVTRQVDYIGRVYPLPHFFEWCFINTYFSQRLAFDFDGILCENPDRPDDDPAYREFLENARPLYLPKIFPSVIISARCQWTREVSLRWLQRHGVRVRKLVLSDGNPNDRWKTRDTVAKWKAAELEKLRQTDGIHAYVESDPHQAEIIARMADMPVICPAAGRVFNVESWRH